jgi:AcrR family transcriptional regulator
MSPSRREAQATETRRLILQTARRHFAEHGYAATSLRAIAADVGVSVQTIYDSVGQKAELVRRLNDLIDEEAQVGDLAASLQTEREPRQVAAVSARITRRIHERCGDLVRASFDAARAEPELATIAAEGTRRHSTGARRVAERLADLGALRPSLSVVDAGVTIAALSDIRLAFVLTGDHGLGSEALEEWMSERIAEAVLADEAADPA